MKNSDDCNQPARGNNQNDSISEPVSQEEVQLISDEIYAIYVAATDTVNFNDLVFDSKEACIAHMRKHKGARFKAFQNRKDALNFTIYGPAPIGRPVRSAIGSATLREERPSPFSTPTPQQYIRFRKAIEKGDLRLFNDFVEENPRYLVSKADSPAILKEGPRYNAIHVACIYNKPQLCSTILEMMASPTCFKRIYPDDTNDCAKRRAGHLLDLYLNTPDKGFNRTPLHYSSVFGFVDCLKALVSYPNCNKNAVDKYNNTAVQLILTRATKPATEEVRAEIEMLLGDHYYVGIFHDEEKLFSPKIGQPMSPSVPASPPVVVADPFNDSVGGTFNPSYKLHGYAGPMSPQQAKGFYSKWRSPAPSIPMTPVRAKIIDNNLDSIGRDLAIDLKLPWKEYWEFLGQFINITSPEGLAQLEQHLQKVLNKVLAEKNELNNAALFTDDLLNCNEGNLTGSDKHDSHNESNNSTIGGLCSGFGELNLNSPLSTAAEVRHLQDNPYHLADPSSEILNNNSLHADSGDDAFDCMQYVLKSASISCAKIAPLFGRHDDPPRPIERLRSEVGSELENLRVVLCRLNAERQLLDFGFVHATMAAKIVETVGDSDSAEATESILDIASQAGRLPAASTHLQCLCVKIAETAAKCGNKNAPFASAGSRCDCDWRTVSVPGIKYQRAQTYLNRLFEPDVREISVVRQLTFSEDCHSSGASFSDDDSESFVTAATSASDSMRTPEEFFTFFIYGSVASKADQRVFTAIEKIEFDNEKYPFISQWFGIVSSYAESLRKTWLPVCEKKSEYTFSSSPHFTNVISSTPKILRESFQSHFDSRS